MMSREKFADPTGVGFVAPFLLKEPIGLREYFASGKLRFDNGSTSVSGILGRTGALVLCGFSPAFEGDRVVSFGWINDNGQPLDGKLFANLLGKGCEVGGNAIPTPKFSRSRQKRAFRFVHHGQYIAFDFPSRRPVDDDTGIDQQCGHGNHDERCP
ncbi:MAG: hypothetical protein JST93_07210 [Acidobacteria bacterium]|nr:hypothetical protein [Acidobacteriota bacterium]